MTAGRVDQGRRVVIVTGAASGIGLATARRFAQDGCFVVLVDLDDEGLDRAAASIRQHGADGSTTMRCDVGNEDEVRHVVESTMSARGRVDVIVNNAGAMIFKPIAALEPPDVERLLATNVVGALWFVKQAFLHGRPGCCVVNVSSVHAVQTSPGVAVYAMAKAGLLALTRAAAIEGREKGIRVNALVVGAVDTPMLWSNPNVRSGEEAIAPGLVGSAEQVASVIAFLADEAASFVNGAAWQVDGGRLAQLS